MLLDKQDTLVCDILNIKRWFQMKKEGKNDVVSVARRIFQEIEDASVEVDEYGLKKIHVAYDELKKMFGEKNVTIELHSPLKTLGSVSINSSGLRCSNPRDFVAIARLGDNIEIYSKKDGSVQVDFAFSDLMKI